MEGQNRKSIRLAGYDYSSAGLYFITICANKHIEWFGNIKNEKIVLNEYGEIVQAQWQWLGRQYPYIELDIFQIMPNHVHGIIGIHAIDCIVGTGRDLSLQEQRIKIKSLSELIGAFKTTSSKLIHANGLPEFAWQRSFYDRVIRHQNIDELNNIREYIVINPANWDIDRNNLKPNQPLLSKKDCAILGAG